MKTLRTVSGGGLNAQKSHTCLLRRKSTRVWHGFVLDPFPVVECSSSPPRCAPAGDDAFSEHSIYVNARHQDVQYRIIADQIASYILSDSAIILDYGCGEALHADRHYCAFSGPPSLLRGWLATWGCTRKACSAS